MIDGQEAYSPQTINDPRHHQLSRANHIRAGIDLLVDMELQEGFWAMPLRPSRSTNSWGGSVAALGNHPQARICRSLIVMVDTFCCDVVGTTQLQKVAPIWNMTQAVLRKASTDVESSLLILCIIIAFSIPLLAIDMAILGMSSRDMLTFLPGFSLWHLGRGSTGKWKQASTQSRPKAGFVHNLAFFATATLNSADLRRSAGSDEGHSARLHGQQCRSYRSSYESVTLERPSVATGVHADDHTPPLRASCLTSPDLPRSIYHRVAPPTTRPRFCVTCGILYSLLLAAMVSEKSSRVPALINAVSFGPGTERTRQETVDYVTSSAAGFYVFDMRLTTARVVKLMYIWCLVVMGVLTRLASQQ